MTGYLVNDTRKVTTHRFIEMKQRGEKISMLKNGVIGGVTATMPLFTGGQIINANKLSNINVEVRRLQRNRSDDLSCKICCTRS